MAENIEDEKPKEKLTEKEKKELEDKLSKEKLN